ncbi:MAG: hypothetical protein ABI718_12085 [Acidobacteriota bacterium]
MQSKNFQIVDGGFIAVPVRDAAFVAHFSGYPGMSLNSVRANLLYHTAEQALQRGAHYIVIRELKTNSVNHARSAWVSSGSGTGVQGPGRWSGEAAGDRAPHSTLTFTTSFVAEGIVEIYEEKPDDPNALDALKFIEQIRAGRFAQAQRRVAKPDEEVVDF